MNQKACLEFALALEKFLVAVIPTPTATVAAPAPATVAASAEPFPFVFPKNFTAWLKAIPDTTDGYELLKGISVVKWTPERVEAVCLTPATVEAGAENVANAFFAALQTTTGFVGHLDVRPAPAPAAPAPKKEKAPAAPKVSAEEVKKAAVQLATKLGDKKRVLEIIAQFGAAKVDEIDASKYGELKAALELAMETSPQMGSNDAY